MLLHRHALCLKIGVSLVVIEFKLCVSVVHVGQFFILKFGFLTETEVLDHDVALDFRDVLFSLLDGISTEVIQQLSVVSIDLLLLPLAVLSTLLLNLVIKRKQHFVTVFFILNFLLLDKLGVFEFQQLLLSFQELLHLSLLVIGLLVVALTDIHCLVVEPIYMLSVIFAIKKSHLPVLHRVLLFGKLALHLLEFHGVLANSLGLLIDLLLQRHGDFHHVFCMLVDLVPGTVYIFLEVL